MKYYKRVEIIDGESTEAVNFVGVHPLKWGAGEPDAGFVEVDDELVIKETKEIVEIERSNVDYDNDGYSIYLCPNCDFPYIKESYNFCPNCGKEIKFI